METYFTVEKNEKIFRSKGQWVAYLHDAAHMNRELAALVNRRYPGSSIESNFGYDVHYKMSLEDVGEPSTQAALATAIRYAKADGWSWETLAVQVEKAFHADGNVKAI